ncbi:MAG: single-stranded DNA-binding protein [Microbacterium sp.]
MTDHITVIGNIASVPERRQLPDGTPAIGFRLASTQRRREDGQWVDVHTNWYSVSAYRKLAEHALGSFEKGQRVIVTGRFRVKHWEANGKSGTSAEIDADGLGHDLMFGTTSFHRRTAAQPDPGQSASSSSSDSWNTQAAPAEAWSTRPIPVDGDASRIEEGVTAQAEDVDRPQAEPALVGGGSWSPPMEDPTPF